MKIRYSMLLLILAVLMLAACKPAGLGSQPSQPGQPAGQPGQGQSYPAPSQSQAAYPNPQAAVQSQQPSAQPAQAGGSLYPDPKSGDEVSYEKAIALLSHGEVGNITAQGDKFSLSLKDGRNLLVKEPAPGALETALKACGEVCKSLSINK